MRIKPFASVFLFCLFCSNVASAASISIVPGLNTVRLGESVNLDLLMDFSDGATTGGGIDIYFNTSALHFSQFTFASGFPTDPAITHAPELAGDHLDALAFGNFDGISGPAKIGTLTLDALSVGSFDITLAATNNMFWGDEFYNAIDFSPITVEFGSATVNVSAVPNPPAFWLFISGMALLARRANRRQVR